MSDTLSASSAYSSLRLAIREHPVATVGGTWAGVLGLTIAYVWTRRIPLQLKIIQGRLVAQGALLGGCILAAVSAAVFEPPRQTVRDATIAQYAQLSSAGGGAPKQPPLR